MSAPPPEKFTGAQLKEAREEFKRLKSLLDKCSTLSLSIGTGKCDFDSIITCLYEIQKNPMYQFLAARDPVLEQSIDVVFLRLRDVGGIIACSNEYDEAARRTMDDSMKDLNDFIEEKKIKEEPGLKRSFAELEGDDDEDIKKEDNLTVLPL